MGRKKRYLRACINLGAPGERSREIVEEFIKRKGNGALSAWLRDMISQSIKPPVEVEYRILLQQLDNNTKIMGDLAQDRTRIMKRLTELGYDAEKEWAILVGKA